MRARTERAKLNASVSPDLQGQRETRVWRYCSQPDDDGNICPQGDLVSRLGGVRSARTHRREFVGGGGCPRFAPRERTVEGVGNVEAVRKNGVRGGSRSGAGPDSAGDSRSEYYNLKSRPVGRVIPIPHARKPLCMSPHPTSGPSHFSALSGSSSPGADRRPGTRSISSGMAKRSSPQSAGRRRASEGRSLRTTWDLLAQ